MPVYSHRSGDLIIRPHNVVMPVSLKVLEHEIFTVTPVKALPPGSSFAPFKLIGMYNADGAIVELEYVTEGDEGRNVRMKVAGCLKFGACLSVRPRKWTLGSNEIGFDYDLNSGLLSLSIEELPEEGGSHAIEVKL